MTQEEVRNIPDVFKTMTSEQIDRERTCISQELIRRNDTAYRALERR